MSTLLIPSFLSTVSSPLISITLDYDTPSISADSRIPNSLLAVGVVTIIAIAPAMLFSETAREVASHGWSSISETASNYWHNWRGNGELL